MSAESKAERNMGTGEGLPDEELDRLRRERFRERVGRVLAVMRQERIDWRGRPYLTSDGRIGVRVEPVEMGEP